MPGPHEQSSRPIMPGPIPGPHESQLSQSSPDVGPQQSLSEGLGCAVATLREVPLHVLLLPARHPVASAPASARAASAAAVRLFLLLMILTLWTFPSHPPDLDRHGASCLQCLSGRSEPPRAVRTGRCPDRPSHVPSAVPQSPWPMFDFDPVSAPPKLVHKRCSNS